MKIPSILALAVALVAAPQPGVAQSARAAAPTVTPTAAVRAGVLLIANQQSASASIVNLATGDVTHLEVGTGPHEAAISADGRLGVVTIYGARNPERQLAVIDMHGRKLLRHVDVPGFRRLHDVAFLPGSSTTVVVTSEASQRVVEVDIVKGQVTGEIDTRANGSHMLALAGDGRTLFTANMGATTASQLDLRTRQFIRQVEVGPRPEGIAITPDGREAWIGSNTGGTVTVVDPASGRILTTIPDLGFPYRITISPGGTRAIIPDPPRRRVHVFDVASRRSLGEIAIDGQPTGVRIGPDERTGFVTLGPDGAVLMVDLDDRRVIRRYTVGAAPDGVAWGPSPAQSGVRALRVLIDSINAATLAGQHARTLSLIEEALEAEPRNVFLLDALVRTHGRLKNHAGVLNALRRAGPGSGIRPVIGDTIFAFMDADPWFVEIGGWLEEWNLIVEARDTAQILPAGVRLGEGLAIEARDSSDVTLYSGGRPRGGISVLRLGEDSTRLLVETGGAVYGMKVDRKRQLWASVSYPDSAGPDRSALLVIDIASGSIVRRFHSPDDGRAHLFNDVAVTAEGTAFVTDSDADQIYVARDTGLAAERPVEVFFAGAPDFALPNGITLTADDARLYVAHFGGIEQWALATGMRRRVLGPGGSPVGFDGLYACAGGLIGIQALPRIHRVGVIDLDPAGTRVVSYDLVDQAPRAGRRLSTGAIAQNTFYYHTGPTQVRAPTGAAAGGAAAQEGARVVIHRVRLPGSCDRAR